MQSGDSAGEIGTSGYDAPEVSSTVFDGDSNIVQATDPRGAYTTFVYNGADELISEIDPDPDSLDGTNRPETDWTYDGAGDVLTVTMPDHNDSGVANTVTDVYDYAGRLETETLPDPDGEAGPLCAR